MTQAVGAGALTLAAKLVRRFEGYRVEAYPDPATGGAPWTIGYGSTRIDGKPVRPGLVITRDEAEAALQDELRPALACVDFNAPGLADNQRAALTSFVYNLGQGAFRESTLLRKLRDGDVAGASAEFPKWCHAAGRVMQGLVNRRAAERAVFDA